MRFRVSSRIELLRITNDPLNHTKKHENQKCFLSFMNRPNQTACCKLFPRHNTSEACLRPTSCMAKSIFHLSFDIFHYYCPNVERPIVCIVLDLIDLTTMPVGLDFNSPRLTPAIRLAGSTGRYHLAVAGGSIRPELRCVYPPATARWY